MALPCGTKGCPPLMCTVAPETGSCVVASRTSTVAAMGREPGKHPPSRTIAMNNMMIRANMTAMVPACCWKAAYIAGNGGGGIRTRDTPKRIPVFKTGAFNRSATPPVEPGMLSRPWAIRFGNDSRSNPAVFDPCGLTKAASERPACRAIKHPEFDDITSQEGPTRPGGRSKH